MCPEIYSLTFCASPSRTTAGKHISHHFTGNLHLSPLQAMIPPLQVPLTRGTDLQGQVKQAVTEDTPGASPACGWRLTLHLSTVLFPLPRNPTPSRAGCSLTPPD